MSEDLRNNYRRKNQIHVSIVLLLIFTFMLIPLSSSHAFVERGGVVSRTLPNGLEVLVREDPAQEVVEVQAWVGVGSRDEPGGKEGIAHLFEHMLFKGTAKRGVGEIAVAIESAGGDINAYTSMDHTVYHVTVAADFFETAMDVLSDALQNSTFDRDELEREKLVVVEEIHRGRDTPARVFSEKMFATAYREHPYGRTVIGTDGSVMGVTRRDMQKFFRKWYVPRNMKLVVVGKVAPADVFTAARKLFVTELSGGRTRVEVTEPEQEKARIFSLVRDTDPSRVTLAFPIVSLTDPMTPVLDVLASVLSEGDSSRLPVALRDSGTVHSAWAYAYTPRDPGLFILGAALKHENVVPALEGLLAQLSRLQNEPVPKAELDRAKTQILDARIFSRERVEGQARELGYLALTLGDIRFQDTYLARVQAVDAMDIMRAARTYFTPEKATVGYMTRDLADQPKEEQVSELLNSALAASVREQPPQGIARVIQSTLPNGIRVLVREDHRLPLVAIRLGFLGGVRFENEKSQGVFNVLASLFTRGTAEHTAEELARELDSMSASIAGFSGRNSFGLQGQFLSRDIREGMALLGEIVRKPSFPEKELELAKGRVISAIRSKKDNLTSHALEIFRATLFREHPYRFATMGTEETVTSIQRSSLIKFYDKVVQPGGMVITLAGDIDVAGAYELVEDSFGDMRGSAYDPGPLPQEMGQSGVNSIFEERQDKEQTHIILGYLGPTLFSKDRDAASVLNAVLAGQGGRLFAELRDKQSLAYSVFSFVAPGLDPGYIAFGIAVKPEREKEAIQAILDQIHIVIEDPVSPQEMDRAARYLIGSHKIGLQDLSSRVDEVFFPMLYGVDLDHALNYATRIRSVTAEDVQNAARKYLDPENYTIAVVRGKRIEERGIALPPP